MGQTGSIKVKDFLSSVLKPTVNCMCSTSTDDEMSRTFKQQWFDFWLLWIYTLEVNMGRKMKSSILSWPIIWADNQHFSLKLHNFGSETKVTKIFSPCSQVQVEVLAPKLSGRLKSRKILEMYWITWVKLLSYIPSVSGASPLINDFLLPCLFLHAWGRQDRDSDTPLGQSAAVSGTSPSNQRRVGVSYHCEVRFSSSFLWSFC